MNNAVNNTNSQSDADLWALASRVCDGTLTADEQTRLDLLLQSEDARQCFGQYMLMHGELLWRSRGEIEQADDASPAAAPILDVSGTAWHNSSVFFPQSVPFCYLVAAVLVGFGLLIGAVMHVSQPEQVVKQLSPLPSPLSPLPSFVGRVTGMVDCRFEEEGSGFRIRGAVEKESLGGGNQKSEVRNQPAPRLQSPVCLGSRFALSSGLMEITYDTGARVILQGPCQYEVSSSAAGYLSAGKLVARVEKKANDECRMMNDELRTAKNGIHHSSFCIHHLFSVRTPTATVTDLGTEFGVEVDGRGATISHVFQGLVSVRATAADDRERNDPVLLRTNESVRVRPTVDGQRLSVRTISPAEAGCERFVRRLSQRVVEAVPGQRVLAWFRMGEDDTEAVAGGPVGDQTNSHSHRQILKRHGSPVYDSDTASPSSSLSMRFNPATKDGISSRHVGLTVNDYFILEAWVKLNSLAETETIVHNGHPHQDGYGLLAKQGQWHFLVWLNEGRWYDADSGVPCELHTWTHLALVCERGKMQLWVNGRAAGKQYVDEGVPQMPDDSTFSIGFSPDDARHYLDGLIDEVRISSFVAPFRVEMLLFRDRDDKNSSTEGGVIAN